MSKTTKLKEIARGHFYMPTPRLVMWGGIIALSLLVLGGVVGNILVDMRRQMLQADIEERLEILAQGRADVISTWSEGLTLVGDHISKADVVRLYASEVALKDALPNGEQGQLNESLLAQEPYMQHMIKEYVHQNNLIQAFMVTEQGRVFLSSAEDKELSDKSLQAISRVIETGLNVITPVEVSSNQLLMSIYKPIFALDEESRTPHVVAVMASTFKVSSALMEFMQPSELSLPGERVHIMQSDDKGRTLKNVVVSEDKIALQNMVVSALDGTFRNDAGFEVRSSAVDDLPVFVSSARVNKAPLIVVHEFDRDYALAPLYNYSRTVYSNMLLLVAVLMVTFTAWLVYVIGARNRRRVMSQQKAMDALVRATEIRDPYLAGHHERVAKLALQIGNVLDLDVNTRSTLYYGAMLSGIGKIFVPQEILTKKGKLTAPEKKKMQAHVEHAEKVLQDVEFDMPVQQAISQMSERLDGSGYPNKLKDGDISQEARILAVCDVFCALTHPRSYRKEMTAATAIKQFEKDAKKFDADVLEALKGLVK